jgi:Ice-binding-like
MLTHTILASRAAWLVTLASSVLLTGACGDDSSGSTTDGGATVDAKKNNPPNPLGAGPAPVTFSSTTDVASAGSFVLLAKTGITNVTGSLITGGSVGVSPAAATFITGFSETADPSNVFSTSASVAAPGKIYASNYAVPSPTNLTTAVLEMQTAYTDAAGRTNPDQLNLGSGEIGGETLAPGLYTWGTGVTIPNDVTLSGGANDVWILQIANDLDLSASMNVILSGGALAKNVFWQVAGKVTIHENSHFEGVILCQTAITLQTTASMKGRALAQSLIALDNNAIDAP